MKSNIIILFFIAIFGLAACNNKSDDSNLLEGDETTQTFEELTAAIEENPDDASLYFKRANAYFDAGLFSNSLSDISKAIELDPQNTDYYIVLADVNMKMGQIVSAKQTLRDAIAINDQNVDAILKLAEINLFEEEYQICMDYIAMAVDIDPVQPTAYLMRGFVYKESGDTARAIENFLKCTEQDPQNFNAYQNLGVLYAESGNPIALDFYNRALEIDPEDVITKYDVGKFYQDIKNYNKAIEVYLSLVETNPDFEHSYFNLGYIHLYDLKAYTEAIGYFNSAIALYPTWTEAILFRAQAYELRGDILNARADYIQVLELDPDNVNAKNALDNMAAIDQMTGY